MNSLSAGTVNAKPAGGEEGANGNVDYYDGEGGGRRRRRGNKKGRKTRRNRKHRKQ